MGRGLVEPVMAVTRDDVNGVEGKGRKGPNWLGMCWQEGTAGTGKKCLFGFLHLKWKGPLATKAHSQKAEGKGEATNDPYRQAKAGAPPSRWGYILSSKRMTLKAKV